MENAINVLHFFDWFEEVSKSSPSLKRPLSQLQEKYRILTSIY